MKHPWVAMAVGVVIGAVAVLLYSSRREPPSVVLDSLPTPYDTVLFENDHVRVVEHRLNAGETEPMHSHPPMLVYFMENADARITGPAGTTFDESLAKGQVLEAPALSHSIENVGDTPLHSILVELKTIPAGN